MAKQVASDAIMGADKMKPLLALSKKEPVQAAIGLTADGDGIILLDKKARPRKVASLLKANAAKAKLELNSSSIRFGRAEVNTDEDAGTVLFFLNKDAPGNMRMKLTEVIKRAAYKKVEFAVDPSLEEEGEDEIESQAGDATAAPPPPAAPDPAALKRDLAGLIGRIGKEAGEDAARKASLAQLAGEANAALKGTDIEAAGAAIAKLRDALDAGGAPQSGGADGFRQDWQKAWETWLEASDTVDVQIDVLGRLMRASDHPGLQEIAETGLSTIFEDKRTKLVASGMRLGRANDGGLAKAVAATQSAVDEFSAYLGSNEKVAACDESDLGAAMSIRSTLDPALKQLAATLARAPAT